MAQQKSLKHDEPKRGLLRTVFSRHAPWPMKILRTGGLMVGAYYATGLLPGEPLSESDTDLFKNYFQDSVNYDKIKIHNSDTASSLMELRGAVALAFNNRIIVSSQLEEESSMASFANGAPPYRNYVLMHEMAHMWQIQNCGQLAVSAHAMADLFSALAGRGGAVDAYLYQLDDERDLLDYGIEQQASIIADYYNLDSTGFANGALAFYLDRSNLEHGSDLKPLYEQTLARFKHDPSYIRGACP